MIKSAYFASEHIDGWPRPEDIERYFLAAPGQEWFYQGGNDTAGFDAEGVEGTEHLELGKGLIIIRLSLWGHPEHGVFLIWSTWGGGYKETYSSKGNLERLREWAHTLHGDLLPVGLFVPFPTAWKAAKEFLENEGARPTSIEWIANKDLPPGTFHDPLA